MSKPLLGCKIAILVANGFCEQDMTETQRALMDAGANMRIVSTEPGLVNGWTGEGWGHHFASDAGLSSALGADYAMLIIPGGQRSHDKLRLTAHTRRFISSFMAAEKPVVVFDDAVGLMASTDNVKGRTVSGPTGFEEAVVMAGGAWDANMPCMDNNVMSGAVNDENRADFIRSMMDFFVQRASMDTVAADQAA